MSDLKLQDSVFPFCCDNPECKEKYDLEKFTEVVLLWGYIYLIAEKDEVAIVGLTCPECTQTTIKKYPAYIAMQCFQAVKFQSLNNYKKGESLVKPELGHCIYFAVSHLIELGLIESKYPESSFENAIEYLVPPEMKLGEYSLGLQSQRPWSLLEHDIPFVLDIENDKSYKAIPRIVPVPSASMYMDDLFWDNSDKNVNRILTVHMIRPNSQKDIDHLSKYNSDPAATNDLSLEEFSHFQAGHLSWERKSFQSNLKEFLNKTDAIRNRIDCELIYRNKLINKFARIFYYKTKTATEQRFEDETLNEIEEWGVEKVAGADLLDDSASKTIRWLDGGQLMDRWNMDAFELINQIKHHRLLAYDSIFSVDINKTSFHPSLLAELTRGDLQQQTLSMKRLRFKPDVVSSFEQLNPELLQEVKQQIQDTPQYSEDTEKFQDTRQYSEDTEKFQDTRQHSEDTEIAEIDFGLKGADLKIEPKVLKPLEKAKICCRKRAEQLWAKYPEMKITHVANHEALLKCFTETNADKNSLRARHEWIKDLAPSNEPGAPTKG